MLTRFKSPIVLASISALLLFLLKNYGLLAPIGLTEESYKTLTTLVFAVLASIGFLNNPTDKTKF